MTSVYRIKGYRKYDKRRPPIHVIEYELADLRALELEVGTLHAEDEARRQKLLFYRLERDARNFIMSAPSTRWPELRRTFRRGLEKDIGAQGEQILI